MSSLHIATQGLTGGPLAIATLGFEGGSVATGDVVLTGVQANAQVGVIDPVTSSGVVLSGVTAAAVCGTPGWTSSEGTAQLGSVACVGSSGKLRTNGALGRPGVVIWGKFSSGRGAGKTAHTGTLTFRKAA